MRIKLNDFFSSQQAFVTRSWVINTKDQLSTTSWEDYVQWNISIWHTTSYKTSAHTHFQGQTSLSLSVMWKCVLFLSALNSIHKGFLWANHIKWHIKGFLYWYCIVFWSITTLICLIWSVNEWSRSGWLNLFGFIFN